MAIAPAYRRLAGVAATLALIAASMVGAGLVMAAGAGYAEDGQQIEFTGGSEPSRHLCQSRPSQPRITVSSGTRVTFVNQLAQPAMLRIDGRDTVLLAPDEAASVVFHRGQVSVSMELLCAAGAAEQFDAVTVIVVATGGPSAGPGADPSARPMVAVERVRSHSGGAAAPRRASGLLALIAAAAVAGVTIAAIRTIIASRTNRVFTSQAR